MRPRPLDGILVRQLNLFVCEVRSASATEKTSADVHGRDLKTHRVVLADDQVIVVDATHDLEAEHRTPTLSWRRNEQMAEFMCGPPAVRIVQPSLVVIQGNPRHVALRQLQ